MKRVAMVLAPLLLASLPFSTASGFGFGFSEDGFNTWDADDYPGGYPRNPYNRWSWGPDYRSFFPPSAPQQSAPAKKGKKPTTSSSDDGWSDWGKDGWSDWDSDRWGDWGKNDSKGVKFGTGNFDFGDTWKPSFGDSWGSRRARPRMPPRPYGYYPPAPGWGAYPPAPWGGYAPPVPAPQAVPQPAPAQ